VSAITAVLVVAPPAAAQRSVPLILQYVDVVLDSATWRDVASSPFVREDFAASDTNARVGIFRGVRLYGRYNYVTLLAPAGASVGDVAIGLGVETAGGFEALSTATHQRVATRGSATGDGAIAGGARVITPVGADSTSDHLRLVISQYDAATAAGLAATDSLPASNRTVARLLAPHFDSHRLFAYVTSVTLAVPVDDIRKTVALLQLDQVKVLPEGEGAVIDLGGITLHLVPPWSGAGVKQLKFALTRDDPANPVYRFGPKSQLRFGPGPVAVWDFAPK
jgi:hypothetical protein